MTSTILHSQSYLYPCQLSTSYRHKAGSTIICKKQYSFAFYSPMDSYLSLYQLSKRNNELIDLQGKRFGLIGSTKMKGGQLNKENKAIVLTNSQQIIKIEQSQQQHPRISQIHKGQKNEQILSNSIISNTTQQDNQKNTKNFNLIYLTKENNGIVKMNICQYEKNCPFQKRQFYSQDDKQQQIDSNKSIANPQDQTHNFISNNTYNHYKQQKLNSQSLLSNQLYTQKSITSIQLPQLVFSSYQHQHQMSLSQSFHLYQLIDNSNQLLIFQKQSQKIHIFDAEYGSVTDVISCYHTNRDHREINGYMLHMEGRKLSILSNNLFIEYDSMGMIKLIDSRISRVVQVRDLNEQFANIRNENISHFQQHFIKYWNHYAQHTQQQNTNQQRRFMINMKNSIVQVDLRYNHNSDSGVFQMQENKMIGNYDIVKSEQSKVIALTTQNQHSFKSYVIEQNISN